MITALGLVILTLGAGIVSNYERLTDKDRRRRRIGYILVAFLGGIAIWQSLDILNKQEKIRSLSRDLEISGMTLTEVDEASGGTTIGDRGYIVDDDSPFIYVIPLGGGQINPTELSRIQIRDTRENSDPRPAGIPSDSHAHTNTSLTDLEGAAVRPSDNERIYLLTSHSNKWDGEEVPARQWFLEVSLSQDCIGCIRNSVNLRDAIILKFNELNIEQYYEERKLIVMNIEGLAIDPEGRVYLGFRAPLVQNRYALVLRAPIAELFGGNPRFQHFFLDLNIGDQNHGIVSMEYDRRSDSILLMTNNPADRNPFTASLRSWGRQNGWEADNSRDDPQLTRVLSSNSDRNPFRFSGEVVNARPEALLLPAGDWFYAFLDLKRQGGTVHFRRSDWGF